MGRRHYYPIIISASESLNPPLYSIILRAYKVKSSLGS